MSSRTISSQTLPDDLQYPHWFDPEYKAANPASMRSYEMLLKLSFLLGHRLVASDVQIWDAYVIPGAFQDKDFVTFLRSHPDLLQIIVSQQAQLSETDPEYEIATSGLRRCLKDGWKSTVFPLDERPIKRLADAILRNGREGLEDRFLQLYMAQQSAQPQLEAHLRSIHAAVKHFSQPNFKATCAVNTTSCTYFQMAKDLSETGAMDDDDREANLSLVDYVSKRGDIDGINVTRSKLFSTLVAEETAGRLAPSKHLQLKSAAIHAWNRATQNSLGVKNGIAGALQGTPISGATLAETGAIFERDQNQLTRKVPALSLSNLRWEAVSRLYDETAVSRHNFQQALWKRNRSHAECKSALDDHIERLSTCHAEMALHGGHVVEENYVTEFAEHLWFEAAAKTIEALFEGAGGALLGTSVALLLPTFKTAKKHMEERKKRSFEIALKFFYMEAAGKFGLKE